MDNPRIPLKHLTRPSGNAELPQGEAVRAALPYASSAPKEELVAALDDAIGAVVGMFAAALRPDVRDARVQLDIHYENLVTTVEVFREEVPKA